MRMTLALLTVLGLSACPKPAENTTPTDTSNKTDKAPPAPVVPSAPTIENRLTQFTLVATSKPAKGYDSDRLFDGDLATAWISRPTEGAPLNIEMALPNDTKQGMCIKKIGLVGGIFGSPNRAAEVAKPATVKLTLSPISKAPAKGKSKGPAKIETTTTLAESAQDSTEIQWLEFPETCAVSRVLLVFEGGYPADRENIAIAELYIEATEAQ